MTENELSGIVLSICFDIHSTLGPGLFENIYEAILEQELVNTYQLDVKRQSPLPVVWKDQKMNMGYRADLIIEHKLIVEIKSIEALAPVHYKQVLTYLRLANIKLGLLVNFNEALLKTGIKRVVNGL